MQVEQYVLCLCVQGCGGCKARMTHSQTKVLRPVLGDGVGVIQTNDSLTHTHLHKCTHTHRHTHKQKHWLLMLRFPFASYGVTQRGVCVCTRTCVCVYVFVPPCAYHVARVCVCVSVCPSWCISNLSCDLPTQQKQHVYLVALTHAAVPQASL